MTSYSRLQTNVLCVFYGFLSFNPFCDFPLIAQFGRSHATIICIPTKT